MHAVQRGAAQAYVHAVQRGAAQAYVRAVQRGAAVQIQHQCIKNFDGKQSLERLDVKEQGKIT